MTQKAKTVFRTILLFCMLLSMTLMLSLAAYAAETDGTDNQGFIELSKKVEVMQTLGKSPAPIRPADFSVDDFTVSGIISVDASDVTSAGVYWSKELPNSQSQDYIVVTGYKSTAGATEDFTVVVADADGAQRTAVVSLEVTPFTDGDTMLLTITDNVADKSYEFSKTELYELWLEDGDVYTYTSNPGSTQEPFIHTMGLTFDALIGGFEAKIQDRDDDPDYSVERIGTRVGVRPYDMASYSQFTWDTLATLWKAYPDNDPDNGIDVPYVIALTSVSLRGSVDDVQFGRMMFGQNSFNHKANSSWLKYIAAWNGTKHGDIAINSIFYTVTFDSNDGMTRPEAVQVKHGDTASKPDDPERTGYTFLGWFMNGEAFDFDTPITENITLAAQWEENQIAEPIIMSATPMAEVEKLNGNKNNLTITIIEELSDGTTNTITETISIDNNASGIYEVGGYKVYVDTKGNTQVRDCRIVN